jgi:hypothetical protein
MMRAALVLVLVVLGGLLGCDDQPPPQREPAGGDLMVSAAVAANEYGLSLALSEGFPEGTAPEPGHDCHGAYEWALSTGARLEGFVRLRVTLSAVRYTQVDGHSLSIRVVDRSGDLPGFVARFSCDMGGHPDYRDPNVPRVELPVEGSEAEVPLIDWDGPLAAVGLPAGDGFSFLVDVTVPGYGELTRFEVVLRADVNGVARTYALRDGDQPFVLLPEYGGAGFRPSYYYWCPGTPGRLVYQPGDDEPLLEPPC